jgi:hypothetical protein
MEQTDNELKGQSQQSRNSRLCDCTWKVLKMDTVLKVNENLYF